MSKRSETYGTICSGVMYTLPEFKRQLGICEATLRSARRAGLIVRYVHKRAFIYGDDWIAYVLNSSRSSCRELSVTDAIVPQPDSLTALEVRGGLSA